MVEFFTDAWDTPPILSFRKKEKENI